MDCIFCKIVTGEIPSYKIYEDENVLAFLDITPINPGHTLVIPKKHYKNIIDTPDELLQGMALAVKKIAPAIIKAVKADAWNLGANNGAVAGQIVMHTHWHIMPRFTNDGHHLWYGKPYADGEIAEVAQRITDNIKIR